MRIHLKVVFGTASTVALLGSAAERSAERIKLSENDRLILEAELAFQASALGQFEAEKRLAAQTQRANQMVKTIKPHAHVLKGAGEMASILSRLINIL